MANRSSICYAAATERALDQIVAYNRSENRNSKKILIIGRFGFDGDHLDRSGLFEYRKHGDKLKSVKYPKMDITYMTAHSSKGLGYDEVIVVNGKNEIYGFPAKIEDDPVLSLVVKEDRSIDYAEERRLFYVAMTRTKNRVYFIAPEKNPSEFLLELKSCFPANVKLMGQWNEEQPKQLNRKNCPVCGYPLQLKFHRSYGLKLYICTNEPELCGFMTNEIRARKLSIMKCDMCRDGYLVIKPSTDDDGYFLGCTNYNRNGTGCSKSISMKSYYEMMKYKFEPESTEKGKTNKSDKINDVTTIKDRIQKSRDNITLLEQGKQEHFSQHELPGIKIDASALMPKMMGVLYLYHDLGETLTIILRAMVHISRIRFYGVSVLNEVLHGSVSSKVVKGNLYTVEEYGKLTWLPINITNKLIYWLIDNHYIHQTSGKYPVLHPTSDTVLFNEKITKGQLKKLKEELEKINSTEE